MPHVNHRRATTKPRRVARQAAMLANAAHDSRALLAHIDYVHAHDSTRADYATPRDYADDCAAFALDLMRRAS